MKCLSWLEGGGRKSLVGREAEGETMFEGEKSWKMKSLGQKTRCWSKQEISTAPSDRNGDGRGIKEMREENTEVSCQILHGLYELLCQHKK